MPRDVRDQCALAWREGCVHSDSQGRCRRSPRGLLHNQCGVSGGMTTFADVTEGKERQKPASSMEVKVAWSYSWSVTKDYFITI
ncbi:hypothetical protein F2Q68_00039508 [Brassica cretica]|uniref:Uncharacterized protein n=1 Tax=Brassica cretica TaxID=69181 RepID=A0A8S9MIJ6_BRACR|nr:hypothetical protein F2Q68_00039508 [Brassica cretica]